MEHPMRYVRHKYRKTITLRLLRAWESSMIICAKHSIENARRIWRDLCACLRIQPGEKCSIGNHFIKITENEQCSHYNGDEYCWGRLGSGVMEYMLCLDIEFENNTTQPSCKNLAQLSAHKCAQYGRIEGLTADAADQVLELDHTLAIRYLY
ncbi:metallopeptidase [Faustovirus]|nr:metallopeptidase [Faustovirus]QJX73497.1 hypothetical protein F-VV63_0231 [Faustovirus]